METYHTVTELFDGCSVRTPLIFRDKNTAIACFNKMVEENEARILDHDEFWSCAEYEEGYRIFLHLQVEIQ